MFLVSKVFLLVLNVVVVVNTVVVLVLNVVVVVLVVLNVVEVVYVVVVVLLSVVFVLVLNTNYSIVVPTLQLHEVSKARFVCWQSWWITIILAHTSFSTLPDRLSTE